MTNDVAALLVEAALKSTLLLAAAFAVAAVGKRFSAEERHFVWALALAALLVLPAASVLVSRVDVPMAQLIGAAHDAETATSAAPGRHPQERGAAAPRIDGAKDATAAPQPSAGPAARNPVETDASGGALAARLAVWFERVAAPAAAVYAVATLLVLAYLAAAAARVAIALRRLEDVDDEALRAMLEDMRQRFGLRRRVRLKLSRSDSTPWAWGAFRPVIVVPEGFAGLSAESQRDAIAHELSHIARLDFVTSLAGCVCCAVYWFQPLAWLALRRMALESERACDDRVLLSGGSSTAYASQLLELARSIRGRTRPLTATAMAGSSSVSRRIASILDVRARRKAMSKTKACAASLLAASIVLPLASLESHAAPADDDELARVVNALIEHGMPSDATAVLADYIARDADGASGRSAPSCSYCVSVLAQNSSAALPALLAAFDEVEARARAAGDGDLLIRLAVIAGASESAEAAGRGTFYLVEGFRLGSLSDASKLDAIGFLASLGWYQEAKDLAKQLHDDSSSGLYQSPDVAAWIRRLDSTLEGRHRISERLLKPGGSFTYSDDVVPLYRVPPAYPPAALQQGIEGSVQIEFTISDRGRPENVTVVKSDNGLFDDSAVEAVSRWLYAPNVIEGTAVARTGVQTIIRFELER